MTARRVPLSDLHVTTPHGDRLSFAEWMVRGLSLRAQIKAWEQDGQLLRETWGPSWWGNGVEYAADEDEWAA